MEEVMKIAGGIVMVVALGIIVLISLSFDSLEYYEYGFARQKSTGKVDLSEVYSSGKHFIGPDYEFKKFRADSHIVNLEHVSAFTRDKLEVKLSANFQYYLKKRDLALLNAAYDIYYHDLMKSSAVDALKVVNAACSDGMNLAAVGALTEFNTRQLFLQRAQVEAKLHKTVRDRLGGTCCPQEYECPYYIGGCPRANNSDCDEVCKVENRGLFVEARFFQLGEIDIPSGVEDRLLESLLLTEGALKEELLQQGQIIRKQTDQQNRVLESLLLTEGELLQQGQIIHKHTDQQVRKFRNDALEISQSATAQSNLIRVTSEANYTNIIETARSKGLKKLYDTLNITEQLKKTITSEANYTIETTRKKLYDTLNMTEQAHKNSFDYLRTLRDLNNIHLTVDFNQRIAGNL